MVHVVGRVGRIESARLLFGGEAGRKSAKKRGTFSEPTAGAFSK